MKGSEDDKGDRDNSGNNRDSSNNGKDSINQVVMMRLSFLTTCLTSEPTIGKEAAASQRQHVGQHPFSLTSLLKCTNSFEPDLPIPFPSQQFRYNRVKIKSGRSDSITSSAHPPSEVH